jgi:Skp family chaperone for outer membrane proteins
MILMATGIAVLAAGTYFGASLFAQGTGGAQPATPAANAGTKIGVVNVGYVFNKWKRAEAFKQELERDAKPFNDQAKKYQEEMKAWDAESKKPGTSKAQQEAFQTSIKGNQRKLEDLADRMRKELGKKSEENLVTLWKDANECIKRVAEAYGFSLVMGYGDPLDKGLMDLFPNVNRKMNAMDAGGAVPLYVHGSCDLSNAVAATLNQWWEHQQKTGGLKLTPTSGGGSK